MYLFVHCVHYHVIIDHDKSINLGKGFILAAYGDESVGPGLLKARMDALKAYLSRVVEKI